MTTKLKDDVLLHSLSGRRVSFDRRLSGIVIAMDDRGYPIVLFDKPMFSAPCHPSSVKLVK